MADRSGTIFWFRQDLRLRDNPALQRAIARGGPVLPVYVLDDDTPGAWKLGGAQRWWLHHSLQALSRDLHALGSRLILRRGPADRVIKQLVAQTGAAAVAWNRLYEPFAIERDTTLKADLKNQGIEVISDNGALLFEPWTVETGSGGFYKVYTPFWRAVNDLEAPAKPLAKPAKLEPWTEAVEGDALEDWRLLPTRPDWAGGLRATWQPGEAAALDRLETFIEADVRDYHEDRDRPDVDRTSRLSPHLHFGELSPRSAWHAATGNGKGRETFRKELVWREFSYHILYHQPQLPEQPLRGEFADFPWLEDADALKAWQFGRTGYPIVDAAMRQLRRTGWMHNRLRMVVGSFLVKNLRLHWHHGEAWFWDNLVDADLASNSASWQWIAGCGADAAPYFRVFNPVLQGEKFDPRGAFVRQYVPEIAGLPDKLIHKPFDASKSERDDAGLRLGTSYPWPIVDAKQSRKDALAAFETIKKKAS